MSQLNPGGCAAGPAGLPARSERLRPGVQPNKYIRFAHAPQPSTLSTGIQLRCLRSICPKPVHTCWLRRTLAAAAAEVHIQLAGPLVVWPACLATLDHGLGAFQQCCSPSFLLGSCRAYALCSS